MNKAELVDAAAAKSGATKAMTAEMLDALMTTIKETLSRQHSVQLIGFGTFDVSKRAAREGRNPSNGNTINIPARTVVRFKAGKKLSHAVAGVEVTKPDDKHGNHKKHGKKK